VTGPLDVLTEAPTAGGVEESVHCAVLGAIVVAREARMSHRAWAIASFMADFQQYLILSWCPFTSAMTLPKVAVKKGMFICRLEVAILYLTYTEWS
jgi:hypothetical protein